MTKRLPLLLALSCGFLTQSSSMAAQSEREQRLLAFGACLGSERLEILTWPDRGEVSRLRFVPLEHDRRVTGKFHGHDVYETKALADAQVKLFAEVLLDVEIFEGMRISRPFRPGPYGRGAGSLCGFLPVIGLRFKDVNDRSLDVLFSYTCNEVAFMKVNSKRPDEGSGRGLHLSVNPQGSARLLRYFANVFPEDKFIRSLRDSRESAGTKATVQQGVEPDGRSPAAPARGLTP